MIELLEALYVAVVRFGLGCHECSLYSGTDEAPPPHDHPDRPPLTAWQRAYVERVLRTLNGE